MDILGTCTHSQHQTQLLIHHISITNRHGGKQAVSNFSICLKSKELQWKYFSGKTWWEHRAISPLVWEHGHGRWGLWVQDPGAPLKCYVTLGLSTLQAWALLTSAHPVMGCGHLLPPLCLTSCPQWGVRGKEHDVPLIGEETEAQRSKVPCQKLDSL